MHQTHISGLPFLKLPYPLHRFRLVASHFNTLVEEIGCRYTILLFSFSIVACLSSPLGFLVSGKTAGGGAVPRPSDPIQMILDDTELNLFDFGFVCDTTHVWYQSGDAASLLFPTIISIGAQPPLSPRVAPSPSFSPHVLITTSSLSHHKFAFLLSSMPAGNLFSAPHPTHSTTNTSTHRFLPPRLLFSTLVVQLTPGISIVSQALHRVRLMGGDNLRTFLFATVRAVEI